MKRSPLAELATKQPLVTPEEANALTAGLPSISAAGGFALVAATKSGAELVELVTQSDGAGSEFANAITPGREIAKQLHALARLYAVGADRIEIALRARK